MSPVTLVRSFFKAKAEADEANWSQFRFYKADDGSRVKETPKQQAARFAFASRRRRQVRRFRQALEKL